MLDPETKKMKPTQPATQARAPMLYGISSVMILLEVSHAIFGSALTFYQSLTAYLPFFMQN